MVAELQSAEFADFSKLRHPSWSTTAELEASVEPRIDVIVGTHVCQAVHPILITVIETFEKLSIMPARCILPICGITPDKERCIALHKVPFYNNERPEAKKRRRIWVSIFSQ